MKWLMLMSISLMMTVSFRAEAEKVKYKKTQEVNFDEAAIDGEVRTPNGAYLNQKRGIKFLPLYKVREQFDRDIKDSVEYLR